MAGFTTSETGMTVVSRQDTGGGVSAGYGDSGSSPLTRTPSSGGSPFATQTTPTSTRGAPVVQVAKPLDERKRAADSSTPSDGVPVDIGAPESPFMNAHRERYYPASIEYNIRDRTSQSGMSPVAIKQLTAAAEAGGDAGLSRVVVVAAKGGGHLSHRFGTEWDLMGYNADGSKWTREQRVAVAAGARSAGANRFGFYEYGSTRPTADGRLHIGNAGRAGPAAMWGAGGLVRGDASRAYNNAAERAFLAGDDLSAFLPTGKRSGAAAAAEAQATGAPLPAGLPSPDARPNPNTVFNPDLAGQGGGQGGVPRYVAPPVTVALGGAILDDRRTVERGWRGPAVTELQEFLSWRGIPVEVDGVFGRQTRSALKAYQQQAEIGVDGRVGPETLQAILYDINPAVAVMPGDTAYVTGKRSAETIVEPGRKEVDIRLPGVRPSREVDIRLPTARPSREPRDNRALRAEIQRGMEGVERSSYFNDVFVSREASDGPVGLDATASAGGKEGAAAVMEMIRRDSAAAADLATKQRVAGYSSGSDRYRTQPRETGIGAVAIRAAEAIRETARGIGDSYREAIERQRIAASLAEQSGDEARDVGEAVTQEALAADPNAANAVVDAYVFGPAGDAGAISDFRRNQDRRRELARRQLLRDTQRGRSPATGNSLVPWGS